MKNFSNVFIGISAFTIVCSAAVAADLPSRSAPVLAPPVAAASAWAGFYIGANLGYGLVRDDVVGVRDPAWIGNIGKMNSKGLFGGVAAGYSWQSTSIVYGLEGDFHGSALKESAGGLGYSASAKIPMFATARVRLGYTVGNALIYATAGIAASEVKYIMAQIAVPSSLSSDKWRAGWAIGGGVEYAFDPNWSAKAEYLYADTGRRWIGSVGAAAPGFRTIETQGFHIFRVGLNYRFGGPSPVVAKY